MALPTPAATLDTPSHSALHNAFVDVTMFGATGDGVTDDSGAIQDAIDEVAEGGIVFLPPGTFKLADGTGLTLRAEQIIRGSGRGSTTISVKNAYAFATPASGALDRVVIEDLRVQQRSGTTTGGAIKAVSNSYHANWQINRVDGEGVSTSTTDPMFWLDGFITSYIDGCQTSYGSEGILVASTGFVSNAYVITRTRCNRARDAASGALTLTGGGAVVTGCVIETNEVGYGVLTFAARTLIESTWFEDNQKDNVRSTNSVVTEVVNNKFHYNHGGDATAKHVVITQSTTAQKDHPYIVGNMFQDASTQGTAIDIGTNVEFAYVAANRGAGLIEGTIVDNGTHSTIVGNDTGAARPDDIKMAGRHRKLNVKTTSVGASTGGDPDNANAIFTVRDDADDNYFMVGTYGIPAFRTGDITVVGNDLQMKSFQLYWDDATGQVKAVVRDGTGAFSTKVLG